MLFCSFSLLCIHAYISHYRYKYAPRLVSVRVLSVRVLLRSPPLKKTSAATEHLAILATSKNKIGLRDYALASTQGQVYTTPHERLRIISLKRAWASTIERFLFLVSSCFNSSEYWSSASVSAMSSSPSSENDLRQSHHNTAHPRLAAVHTPAHTCCGTGRD